MSRYDLTDFEWRVIAPLLPNKPRGRADHRHHRQRRSSFATTVRFLIVADGIFAPITAGARWRTIAIGV